MHKTTPSLFKQKGKDKERKKFHSILLTLTKWHRLEKMAAIFCRNREHRRDKKEKEKKKNLFVLNPENHPRQGPTATESKLLQLVVVAAAYITWNACFLWSSRSNVASVEAEPIVHDCVSKRQGHRLIDRRS
ncbi:hypothetical protein CEXT_57601 [Caerostris extrusa]|uniref:Uncharacterized protein n=1 Tax=Caerostris extrusa TaxID=172846 RepID=A0AAV4TT50_CAEEX|nr:hypothetical protein CEXT_57601 [Caerostris extrusa]